MLRAVEGSPYPSYGELQEAYGAGSATIARAVAELRRRGVVARVPGYRGMGQVVGPRQHNEMLDQAHAHPATCPQCGGGRRGPRHPVRGYVCARCARSAAAQ